MVNKVCECCGKEFEAKRSTARFCSDTCKKRNQRGTKLVITCIICGKKFPVAKGGRKYCSEECSEIALQNDRMNDAFTRNSYFDAAYDDSSYNEDFLGDLDYEG